MKISQLLIQPHGTKIGGLAFTIKTCKKTWQVEGVWWHQVVFMDESGEIPADVKIGKYKPLHRGMRYINIIGEVRDAEYLGKPRKILVVEQYKEKTITMEDYYEEVDKAYEGEIKVVRSKIKCLLTAGYASREAATLGYLLEFVEDERLDRIVDAIIGG